MPTRPHAPVEPALTDAYPPPTLQTDEKARANLERATAGMDAATKAAVEASLGALNAEEGEALMQALAGVDEATRKALVESMAAMGEEAQAAFAQATQGLDAAAVAAMVQNMADMSADEQAEFVLATQVISWLQQSRSRACTHPVRDKIGVAPTVLFHARLSSVHLYYSCCPHTLPDRPGVDRLSRATAGDHSPRDARRVQYLGTQAFLCQTPPPHPPATNCSTVAADGSTVPAH